MIRALAVALAVAAAGCQAPPPVPCQTAAACLLELEPGTVTLTLHLTDGTPVPGEALGAIARQLAAWSAEQAPLASRAAAIAPREAWNESALAELHAREAPGSGPGDLHVYALQGTLLVGDEPASGLAFPGTPALFLFPDTMDLRVEEAGHAGVHARFSRASLERVVAVHELGHALGLVGCGLPMQAPHDDPGSPCHSANPLSVMHARVARVGQWPSWDSAQELGPFAWDADDRADLAAAGARA